MRALLLLCAMAPLGCGLIQFDVPVEGDSQVPGCIGITCVLGQLGFTSFSSLDLSQSQEWQNNQANKDKVSSATLTAASLDVTVPDGGDLSFLQSLQFFVAAPDAGQALVAEGQSFPLGQSHVDLVAHPEVELAPFVKAPTMTITTTVSGTQPSQNTTVHAKVNFHIKL
jgi:hypothetical protein